MAKGQCAANKTGGRRELRRAARVAAWRGHRAGRPVAPEGAGPVGAGARRPWDRAQSGVVRV